MCSVFFMVDDLGAEEVEVAAWTEAVEGLREAVTTKRCAGHLPLLRFSSFARLKFRGPFLKY